MVFFTWAGCDEMDEVIGHGHGSVGLLGGGSPDITFVCPNGNEAILKAKSGILLRQSA